LKHAVEHRSLQHDEKTYCFSRTLFFYATAEGVNRIDPNGSDFSWISSRLAGLEDMKMYTGKRTPDLLDVLREKLTTAGAAESFPKFLFCCGKVLSISENMAEI
jgi:hypothetical protein